jgi:hypothetical protein
MHIAAFFLTAMMAQASMSAPVDPQAKAKAQALLKDGTSLYEHGDLVGALDKFEAAFAVFPSPKLQFNIGQANRDLGRPVEALEAFERFLASAKEAAPELVAEARQSAADLAGHLGRVKVECPTAGADAALDGKPLGTTPISRVVWVVPGRHQVTLRRKAAIPVIADVNVAQGETQLVQRTLLGVDTIAAQASTPPPPPAAVATQAPGAERSDGSHVWSRQRWYFWTAAAGTVVFATTAIVTGLSANSRYNDLLGSCGQTTAGCSDAQISSVSSRITAANIFWGLTGVSAVAAGLSFYLDSRERVLTAAWNF